ncbi:beta-lactamase/transpeptidase-like protein [Cubamyces lactineus]|nr:beta-lactamase/transpeptidase-like protein [Cubamyces lactineus]
MRYLATMGSTSKRDVILLQVKQQRRVTQRCAQLALGLALLLAIWKWNRIWASVMKALPTARHAQREPIISPDISDIARKYMREGKVPGLSAGVVRLGVGIPDVEFGSWGTMSEDGADVTADTLYNIGSCSKAFLSTTMAMLMEDFRTEQNKTPLPPGISEFNWNTKLSELLPTEDWLLDNEWATKEANMGDIMSHVSGLPRHDFAWFAEDSPLDIVRRLRHLKTTNSLRLRWEYNNQMYIVASHIISRYAGMNYTTYAIKRLLQPLRMYATTFSPSEADRTGNLSHAWSSTGRRIPLWSGADAVGLLAGPGGVISSARDMTKWLTSILPMVREFQGTPSAEPRGRQLMDTTVARAIMYGASAAPSISVLTYGMGWMRMTYLGHELVFHSGSIPGYRTLVFILPRQNAGVVTMANSDDYYAVHELVAFNLVHRILGLPLIPEPHAESQHAVQPSLALHRLAGSSGYYQVHQPVNSGAVETYDKSPQASNRSLLLEKFAGSYSNVGYGNLTLCAPFTESAYCERVRTAFALTHNHPLRPSLLAEWPRLLATHLQLESSLAHSPNLFWATTHYIFPEGYGKDRSPFDYELFPPGLGMYVECVVRDGDAGTVEGCGLFLTIENYREQRHGAAIREQAEVWFEKID